MKANVRMIACAAALSVALLPAAVGADDAPPPGLQGVGIDQRLNEQVPLDLSFRDESGKTVRLRDYVVDKPVILTMVYYECPMLCTLVLKGLVKALRPLKFDVGNQFDIVTVSFNPKETSALAAEKKDSILSEYKRPGAAAGWHFLTGDVDQIERLAKAVGFRYKYLPKTGQYAHAAAIMVLTPGGKLARYFYGVEYSPRDLRLGLIEAAKNKIGTPVDQVLLYCFQYDPSTGRYSAVVLNIIRLGGVVTIVLLGGFMLVMFRRDSKASRRQRT